MTAFRAGLPRVASRLFILLCSSLCFLKEMRDCWNSAKVRQRKPQLTTGTRGSSAGLPGENSLAMTLLHRPKARSWVGHPLPPGPHPGPDGTAFPSGAFHSMGEKRVGAGRLQETEEGTDAEDCSCPHGGAVGCSCHVTQILAGKQTHQ